jgi:hypothetical protein
MDAFELLKADHKKVAGLFDQLEAATGKAKLGVFDQIRTELELHAHIEEKIFYPALEKPEETHDLTLEAYEEHDVVKALLAELSTARNVDDEWEARAKVLRENVEHHVEEEENELFDKADDVLSEEQIDNLGRQMEAEKARQQGRGPAQKGSTKKAAGKGGTKKGGLVSRLANFVGLGGSNGTTKKSGKKAGTKKSASKTTKKAAKKSGSKSGGTKSSGSKSGGTKRGGTKKAAGKKSSKSAAKKTSKGSKKSGAKKTRRSSR